MSTVTNEDREALMRLGKAYFLELHKLPFTSKKPNKNTPLKNALAIQCLALTNFFIMIKDSEKDSFNGRVQVPMALRSFLEVVANINYIVLNKNNSGLIRNYLSASNQTAEGLWGAFEGKKVHHRYWCDISISKRIQILQNSREVNCDYVELYYHLSSFVHAHPSHLSTSHIDYEKLYSLYYTAMSYLLIALDRILHEGGVVKGSLTIISLARIKLEQEEKKKKPSLKDIEMYKSILHLPGIEL